MCLEGCDDYERGNIFSRGWRMEDGGAETDTVIGIAINECF